MALYTVMKGPVDYTVVGSPTITDGVVSGFSSSNRLETTSTFDPKKPYKIQAKFNLSTLGVSNTILGVATAGIFNFCVNSTNLLHFLIGNTNTDWNVLNLKGTTVLAENTDYWAQAEFTGTQYILRLSTDGITWNQEASVTSSTVPNPGNPFTLRIGDGHTQHWYFRGSIDLKQTFIECENQLWFGYEPLRVKIRTAPYERYAVVGSPTISGGIASDFTKNNYVMTNSTFPGSTTTSLEFATKINVSSFSSTSTVASSTTSTIPFHLAVRDSKFRFYPGRENIYKIGDFVLSANTNYWIKLFWDSTNGWKLQYSTDGATYTTDFENYKPSDSAPKNNYVVIGRNYPNGGQEPFLGTIDLNETYIKVNGQYWWRGDMQYVQTYTLHQGE